MAVIFNNWILIIIFSLIFISLVLDAMKIIQKHKLNKLTAENDMRQFILDTLNSHIETIKKAMEEER